MRSGLIWLAMLAAGIALFFYGGSRNMRDPMAMPLVYAGSAVALVGLIMLIVTWRASRRRAYTDAVRATDAVARWQVYPSDMERFRGVDEARAGRLWSLENFLKLPDPAPPEGFPVVVGETSLLIGDTLHDYGLEEFGTTGDIILHEGDIGFIEIHSMLETANQPLIIVQRIPFPAGARNEAAKAFAHLAAQVKPHDRARVRSRFSAHFEAADQATDAPHRLQRRRKFVIPLIALFFLAMLAFILYSVMRPGPSLVPNETFPIGNAADPPPSNETDPFNAADPATPSV